MGIADVIPGVSGGTLALILGIYRELIDTIKSVNPRILVSFFNWLKNGRESSDWDAVAADWKALNVPFVATLGFGIVCAFAVGSKVIPYVMENYPEPTRGFFFGLILASIVVPFRMIDSNTISKSLVVFGIVLGTALGWVITNPANRFDASTESFEVSSEGETLKDILRRGPSADSAEVVFWTDENKPLRDAIQQQSPAVFEQLSASHDVQIASTDKAAVKAKNKPYHDLMVPKDTIVAVPRLALWFVFFAGMIAICAMILPGISGSYILLILNAYFFMLNALKGFIETLAHGALPMTQASYVVVFCAGAAIGLLGFARVLSYLLERHGGITLAILVGLMIGCLRGVWPYQRLVSSEMANVWPGSSEPNLMFTIGMLIIGAAIVTAFTVVGQRNSHAN